VAHGGGQTLISDARTEPAPESGIFRPFDGIDAPSLPFIGPVGRGLRP
jgi:hypothetical protein